MELASYDLSPPVSEQSERKSLPVLRGIGWGLLDGLVCGSILGSMTGTIIFPVFGTVFGLFYGAVVGVFAGAISGLLIGCIALFNPDERRAKTIASYSVLGLLGFIALIAATSFAAGAPLGLLIIPPAYGAIAPMALWASKCVLDRIYETVDTDSSDHQWLEPSFKRALLLVIAVAAVVVAVWWGYLTLEPVFGSDY